MTSTLWLRPLAVARLTFAPLTLAFAATWMSSKRLVFSVLLDDIHVVNQAGGAQRRRAEHDQQVGMVVALRMGNPQREAVAHGDVVDLPAAVRELHPALDLEIGIVGAAGGDRVGDLPQHAI